jgi:hypothetical protein
VALGQGHGFRWGWRRFGTAFEADGLGLTRDLGACVGEEPVLDIAAMGIGGGVTSGEDFSRCHRQQSEGSSELVASSVCHGCLR